MPQCWHLRSSNLFHKCRRAVTSLRLRLGSPTLSHGHWKLSDSRMVRHADGVTPAVHITGMIGIDSESAAARAGGGSQTGPIGAGASFGWW